MPLHMNRTQSCVVAMQERVGQGLTKRPLGIVGNPDAEETDHDFLFSIPGPKPCQNFLKRSHEWPPEEVVDLNGRSPKDLKGHLVGRQQPPERRLSPKEQESSKPDSADLMVPFDYSQGFGQLFIREVNERAVASAAALTDRPPIALDLEGVDILPGGALNDERAGIDLPAVSQRGRNLVEVKGPAAGLAASQNGSTDILTVGSPHRLLGAGYLYGDDLFTVPWHDEAAR